MRILANGKNLEHCLKRQNNNYDLIRLLAAITVIVFHAFYLFKGTHGIAVNTPLEQIRQSSGSLAVYVFLFLSGMFITASFIKSQNSLVFIIMRVFRIWPALIVCVIFTVFVAGVLVSTNSAKEYFGARGSWDYLVHGVLLYHLRYELPGVFETNYYRFAVNGSLWTLPIEVCCYFMIYVLGIQGVLKNTIITVVAYAIILGLYYLNFYHLKDFLGAPFPYFIIGSLFYFFRQYIIVDYRISAVLIIVCFFFYTLLLLNLTLFYTVIVVGASAIFKRIHLPGDYSYGVYIYGFIIQQLIAHYFPHTPPVKSIFMALPVVLLIAVLSWHLIELPAIKMGKKLALRSQNLVFFNTKAVTK